MMQIYHTVYENTKRKNNSFAYFNKIYNNPRPLDIGTFVLKRNFLHVHFSDKLKPLRIGPFKIISKISDITYEIVNQDGYTSHIHRNHLVPYYPKEPIIFLFLQQYNPHSSNNNYNDSDLNDPLQSFDFLSDEEQSFNDDQFTHSNSNKKRIYHPQLISNQNHLVNTLHFRTNKIHQKPITLNQKIKLIFTITIILLILEDTPIIDIISAHTCVRSSTWWVRTRNGHKVGRTDFSLGGTYTKSLTWLLIILIDMHWWDLNTKSFWRFSAIKNTY